MLRMSDDDIIPKPPPPDIPFSMHYDKRVLMGPHGALEAIVLSIVPDPDADPILFAIRAEDWYQFAVSSAAFCETEFNLNGDHRKRVSKASIDWNPPV